MSSLWTAQGHIPSQPLGKSSAGLSKTPHHWEILKIPAINHSEEQHYLSNVLGFFFQSFTDWMFLNKCQKNCLKINFRSIKSWYSCLGGWSRASIRDILKSSLWVPVKVKSEKPPFINTGEEVEKKVTDFSPICPDLSMWRNKQGQSSLRMAFTGGERHRDPCHCETCFNSLEV